jgi:hypothetical protein
MTDQYYFKGEFCTVLYFTINTSFYNLHRDARKKYFSTNSAAISQLIILFATECGDFLQIAAGFVIFQGMAYEEEMQHLCYIYAIVVLQPQQRTQQ